jgi:hypothetical protein
LPSAARKKKTGSEKNWNYQRGAKDCMRFSDSIKPMIFGFILAIGITLTQPYLAFCDFSLRNGDRERPKNRLRLRSKKVSDPKMSHLSILL